MHTIVLHDENGQIRGRVHHNADWSGEATLAEEGAARSLVYPAELLRAAACAIALMYLREVAEEGIGEPDVRAVDVEDTLLAGHVVRSAMVAKSAHWIPLRDAPKGSVFETRDGVQAVKSEYGYDRGGCLCILLASGEFAHFGKTPKEHDATLVRVVR